VHNKQTCTPHTAFAYEFGFPLISLEIRGMRDIYLDTNLNILYLVTHTKFLKN
jgi:hypothetical protein